MLKLANFTYVYSFYAQNIYKVRYKNLGRHTIPYTWKSYLSSDVLKNSFMEKFDVPPEIYVHHFGYNDKFISLTFLNPFFLLHSCEWIKAT